MKPCKMDGVTSSQFLNRAIRACVEQGASETDLLNQIGLNRLDLYQPAVRFPARQLTKLFSATATQLKDPAIGLLTGLAFRPRNFSDRGYGLKFESSFAEILAATANHQWLIQTIYQLQVERAPHRARFKFQIGNQNPDELRPLMEATLASYSVQARALVGVHFPPFLAVGFQHADPGYSAAYKSMFGCEVRFDQAETYMDIENAMLDWQLPGHNLEILKIVNEQFDEFGKLVEGDDDIVKHCYYAIQSMLEHSAPNLPELASAFNMAERTLRRRLEQSGTNFREILERVRRDLCQLYLLEGSRSIGEISELLGYSGHSAFTRAFSSWHGVPPKQDMLQRKKAA